MTEPQRNNPLHGITLEMLLTQLVARYGWAELGRRTRLHCFLVDPSMTSSLRLLRRTPWARQKVERLYLASLPRAQRPKRTEVPPAKPDAVHPELPRKRADRPAPKSPWSQKA